MSNYIRYSDSKNPSELVKPDEEVLMFYNSHSKLWHLFQANKRKCMCEGVPRSRVDGHSTTRREDAEDIESGLDLKGDVATYCLSKLSNMLEEAEFKEEISQ